MRISAGILKGLYLKPIKDIRPTQDKVKNAIFNILGDSINGARFLELFAGSGIVGFEALSRGASKVVFIENNPVCVRAIEDTIVEITPRIGDRDIQIFRQDALTAIERLYQRGILFDIVFTDPPYCNRSAEIRTYRRDRNYEAGASFGARNTLQTLSRYDIIVPSGLIIIQASCREELADIYATLALVRSYRYGDTVLRIYQKKG